MRPNGLLFQCMSATSGTKGERTRARIIATVAPVFNQRGYAGTSLEDVMTVSGLKKGGVYRHFESKDELAVAAFEHSLSMQSARVRDAVDSATTAEGRLSALVRALARNGDDPAVAGGCPLLNTAIECDDATGPIYTKLKTRTRRAMTTLIKFAEQIVRDGVASGEFRADVNANDEATALVGSLEGALMLSKLYGDPSYVQRAADCVELRVRTEFIRQPRARASR
jgi:TetR/AcrR family transcriptional repressor of nem operon